MIPLAGPGLVLRRAKRDEADLRLTVLLRDAGKILVLSKGGQRPLFKLRAIQEPFTEADFHLFVPPDNGVNGRLAGGKLLDSHQGIRSNFPSFEAASRMLETVDVLVPFRAPAADVYDILRAALRSLSSGAPAAEEWILFVARLLRCLGHGDVTERLLALLDPSERKAAAERISEPLAVEPAINLAPASLDRCRTLVDAELEHILPWRLKSDRASADEQPKDIST